jgi:hypothetical protein
MKGVVSGFIVRMHEGSWHLLMHTHAQTDTDKHIHTDKLCCAMLCGRQTEQPTNLEDVCELGVAEGHMGRACGQGMDAVSKGTQALVDELGFPEALPLGLSLAHPLTPCQIHQPQLGPPHIPCTYTNTLQTPEEDEYTINVL